jgi:hypothetical protein
LKSSSFYSILWTKRLKTARFAFGGGKYGAASGCGTGEKRLGFGIAASVFIGFIQ